MSADVQARGKFLFLGEEKLYLRGITYGTFRPAEMDGEYGTPETVARDFAMMAERGVNAVRTYSVPPRWLLDTALRHGLRVLVGLAWEQHVAFLDDRNRVRSILARVRSDVRRCAGHAAVLGYTIGNEIPVGIVRWFGRHRIERFLKRLYQAVKSEDADALVTYVNYPSTEYLQLPFLDFVAFNVYLESEGRYAAYLARLQNIAGDRPLVISEIGLDSARNGEGAQARAIESQIGAAFAAGCAGTFVFQWTDEWYRGGAEVTDWDFGVTDRARRAKPALATMSRAYASVPFSDDVAYPFISVVVCSHNGARTLRDCCEGLSALAYSNYEVIVVDDGSTDQTAAIAASYGFHVISIPNGGLSHARNVGLAAAAGDYIAYLDDDAWPDPDWLTYLREAFLATPHVGIGGPNIPPPDDGPMAHCVAHAPGGPIHVLLSDHEAEHIPGCNMAFRATSLRQIGGFDPQFRVAGDDVDVCWRLQHHGGTLGFSPSAVVWHRRRDSVRRYWRQQVAYGKAEALLERKWPEKYNVAGHLTWSGRMYGAKLTYLLRRIGRIYQGTWGSALFQTLDLPTPSPLSALPQMPEWYFMMFVLATLAVLGARCSPVGGIASALLLLSLCVTLAYAAIGAAQSVESDKGGHAWSQRRIWVLTTCLFLIQPIARLVGRVRHGLTPWRSRIHPRRAIPTWCTLSIWSEYWLPADRWLERVEGQLKELGARTYRGGDYDRWDLRVSGGIFGSAYTRMAIEEHAVGKQFARFRVWPRCSGFVAVGSVACAGLGALATEILGRSGMILVALFASVPLLRTVWELAITTGTVREALRLVAVATAAEPTHLDAPPEAHHLPELHVPAQVMRLDTPPPRAEHSLHIGMAEGD